VLNDGAIFNELEWPFQGHFIFLSWDDAERCNFDRNAP